jgi:hypothetical protein
MNDNTPILEEYKQPALGLEEPFLIIEPVCNCGCLHGCPI